MWAVANDAQRGLVTLLLALELATFLGWHVESKEALLNETGLGRPK
jgi:hypothetical protein